MYHYHYIKGKLNALPDKNYVVYSVLQNVQSENLYNTFIWNTV